MADKIYRAGLIPYVIKEGEIVMMFMKPSDPKFGGPDFQVAKGKVDPGETIKEAAIREAKEELGLMTGNIDGEVLELGEYLGRTYVYVCKVFDQQMFAEPHYETGAVAWMTKREYEESGRELHVPIIRAAHKLITVLEKL